MTDFGKRLPLPEPSTAEGFSQVQRQNFLVPLCEVLQQLNRIIRERVSNVPPANNGVITLNGTWRFWVRTSDDTLHCQHLESGNWVTYHVWSQNAI